MKLFPAIDIYNGKCVRLLHGKFDNVTHYGSPLEMAIKWKQQGADFLHLVDLNGAKDGDSINLQIIAEIAKTVNIPVQTGGGIRSLQSIETRLNLGVNRVILGTVCCNNPDLVCQAIKRFGAEKIVCGIDANNGFVSTHGWQEKSELTPIELGCDMYKMGVRYVVYTDISRDGALTGVNVEASRVMMQQTSLNVIASGGVSTLNDITQLKAINMYGVILGKAIYENKFSVTDAANQNNK